jgi:hypothetical protein
MNMNNIFFNFSHPLLEKLNEGKTIKFGFQLFFWVLAVLSLLAALYVLYMFFNYMGALPTAKAKIAGFLYTLSMVFALWISFQIFLFRAKTIADLHNSSYVVTPIVSIFFRTFGEVMACIIFTAGVVAGLSSLIAGSEFAGLPGAGAFAQYGVGAIIAAPIMAFMFISFFYLIAEGISCLPEIAVSTKRTADALDKNNNSNS